MKWNKNDLKFAKIAARAIDAGASVYSQVYLLYYGALANRSWGSIRSKVNRLRNKEFRENKIDILSAYFSNEEISRFLFHFLELQSC